MMRYRQANFILYSVLNSTNLMCQVVEFMIYRPHKYRILPLGTTNLTHLTVSTNPTIDLFLSPGFPLTLRLENPIQESLASVSSFGHPVVDTTGAIGQGK